MASSTHLYLSWKDAFKDCDENQIVTTNVRIGSQRFPQILGAKEAKVEANPCLRHEVKVILDKGSLIEALCGAKLFTTMLI